jgi:hypothetical protein
MRKQEYKRKKMKKIMNKILISLAVVMFANVSFAQMKKNVELAVDKSLINYGDVSCLKNPTHTIQCKGKNFYSSNENYELNIKYKESCYYYRYSDDGYWNIDLSLEKNGQKSKVLDSAGYDFNILSLNEFKINYFKVDQPFQINIFKKDDVISSLQVQKLKLYQNNYCKPGSALSDDYCYDSSYSFATEEYLFRDMECVEPLK